jgi:site-specific DNA-methyltransferase (adenine-specific)
VEDTLYIKDTERNKTPNFPYALINKRLKMDGLELLNQIPKFSIKACFFDPQYRGILDRQKYGNEGKKKEARRLSLPQMSEITIEEFIKKINSVLVPSGHLFLWIDKFHLCEGVKHWLINTELQIVDLITWEKHKIGMGYRSRRKSEYLLILQKKPIRAKGIWTIHNIPDVWEEKVNTTTHPHSKPIELQKTLIRSISNDNDIILDPAMGSGSVFTACSSTNRVFIGSDING